eukprot:1256647-Alexandrium_andersonii.AAC.1
MKPRPWERRQERMREKASQKESAQHSGDVQMVDHGVLPKKCRAVREPSFFSHPGPEAGTEDKAKAEQEEKKAKKQQAMTLLKEIGDEKALKALASESPPEDTTTKEKDYVTKLKETETYIEHTRI